MSDVQRQIETYIKDVRPQYEEMLGQAMEIPSISMDPQHAPDVRRMAELAAQYLRAAGAEAHIVDTPGYPVGAALLATGNERRGYVRGTGSRFTYLGAPRRRQSGLWEDHWRIRYNEPVHPSSEALMALLDDMASGRSLKEVIEAFLSSSATAKDWRYYIVKYEVMRGENLEFSGNYVIGPDHGYSVCMPKTDSCDNRSNHHDAYLLALVEAAGPEASKQIENQSWPRCFPGNEDNLRHVKLRRSGLKIRCIAKGWEFSEVPSDPASREKFDEIAVRHSLPHSRTSPRKPDW